MSITIATENAERLPENMLFEILSRLPVKDVLQYKTVCKSWYNFVSTPQFISKHLKNNCYYDDNCLLTYCFIRGKRELHQLFLDQTPRVLANQVLSKIPVHDADIYGPCDGLYYLYSHFRDVRAIWNPTINEVRTLPPPPITKPDPPNTKYSHGFGVDPLSGDYKVVVIQEFLSTIDEIARSCPVMVYSLRNDSWKYCGDLILRYYLKNNGCYIFVKRCYFWLGSFPHGGKSYEIIITFDMASDSFQEITVPVPVRDKKLAQNTLGMYDDSLAFFTVDRNKRSLGIWTLNLGTWTKIFNTEPILDVWYPLGHWKSNKVLLVSRDYKLVSCDPNTREINDLDFEISRAVIFPYMESLVSVKGKITPREDDEKVDTTLAVK